MARVVRIVALTRMTILEAVNARDAFFLPPPFPGRCPGLCYPAPRKVETLLSLREAVRRRSNLSSYESSHYPIRAYSGEPLSPPPRVFCHLQGPSPGTNARRSATLSFRRSLASNEGERLATEKSSRWGQDFSLRSK